ncbi:MAG: hypothetical protein NVSMB21_09100 [Vulcanimicrobiaceae bacterium]
MRHLASSVASATLYALAVMAGTIVPAAAQTAHAAHPAHAHARVQRHAKPRAVAARGDASKVKFGVFARLSPGSPPFSMVSPAHVLDARKAQNILDLGATWTRSSLSPFFTDRTFLGPGRYDWSAADVVTSWDVEHRIEPVIGIEAGPVQVNDAGKFDPHEVPVYPTSEGFAAYCGAAARHFRAVTHSFSIPGNEINSDLGPASEHKKFSGLAMVAEYTKDCYRAVKAADPSAFVWGFELNMDAAAGPTAFVSELAKLGCGPGRCYDGLSMHLGLRYPLRPRSTPCFPNAGGDYSLQCIPDIQHASGKANLPIMIGETAVTWPGMVPDEEAQASFAPAALRAMAAMPGVRYINYANLDECALYPSGYFMNGCIVDKDDVRVPAWRAVRAVFRRR